MSVLDDFLRAASTEIERRAALATDHRQILVEGAVVFAEAVQTCTERPASSASIGAVHQLTVIDVQSTANAELSQLAIDAAAEVPWVPTPRLDADDGHSVGLGLIDKVREFGDITCGLMLLASGARYPEHRHPPQEVYLPITGTGTWRFGGSENYRQLAADELVYNNPGDLHSAIAATEPELALYFLWP